MKKTKLALLVGALAFSSLLITSCSKEAPQKPNFSEITNIKERKQSYITFLLPLIHNVQAIIQKQRTRLLEIDQKLQTKQNLSSADLHFLDELSTQYRVKLDANNTLKAVEEMKFRVNSTPTAMILAQSALETGWGTSRFAAQGNNYFGQHCFTKGCGMVPRQRAAGAINEVQVFKNPQDSVQAYFNLLNTGTKFQAFRELREDLASQGKPLTGKDLINTLVHYSELQDGEYEKRLLITMNSNNLYQYN